VTPRDKLRASLRANSEHVRQWPAWLRAAISTAEVFANNEFGVEPIAYPIFSKQHIPVGDLYTCAVKRLEDEEK